MEQAKFWLLFAAAVYWITAIDLIAIGGTQL